jgi:hypothetical protein
MMKNNYRGYEKELSRKGVNLIKRHVAIPEGCWMCGKTGVKMSKEHVIPDWLLKYYDIGDQIMRQAHVDANGTILSTREVKYASLRQGKVCERNCNNGWMRKLEDEFAKVFKNDWKSGLEMKPLIFARWIAKTLTIINISQPRRVLIGESARHGLANSDNLPDGWSVYIYETDSEMPELITWEQGCAMEIGIKDGINENTKDIYEQVFAGCIKIGNLIGVAYYAPKNIKDLTPIFPFKMIWPTVSGEIPTLPYGGMLLNQCLINLDIEKSDWAIRVGERRKSAIQALSDSDIEVR